MRACTADVGAKLLCGKDAEALRLCRMWIAEETDEPELAWTTLGRCHLWMCNVDDVAKLPTQSPHVAGTAAVVTVATAARECKSRGNVEFQAGDFGAAERSYSDGAPSPRRPCAGSYAEDALTVGAAIAGAKAIAECADESVWGQRFRAVLLTNRAAARARQQHWLDALADCHLALRLHPRYLKALKRRGDLYQVRAPAAVPARGSCRD